jgi:hypothetical protein
MTYSRSEHPGMLMNVYCVPFIFSKKGGGIFSERKFAPERRGVWFPALKKVFFGGQASVFEVRGDIYSIKQKTMHRPN